MTKGLNKNKRLDLFIFDRIESMRTWSQTMYFRRLFNPGPRFRTPVIRSILYSCKKKKKKHFYIIN